MRKFNIKKMILFPSLGLLAIILTVGLSFYFFSPQFGSRGKISGRAKLSPNFKEGVFHNQEKTAVMLEFKWNTMSDYFKKGKKEPDFKIPVRKLDTKSIKNLPDSSTRITWFGHSALLLETEGKKIFLDPMLGKTASPLPFMGPKRFNEHLPLEISQLPELDAVLISHDHYDHLDYQSIVEMDKKVKQYFVPLGVSEHLTKWGVNENKITEMDWWEVAQIDSLQLVAAPSRHFSGRGLTDRNTTLWCSWIIKGDNASVYFSGDSGYGSHFKNIGEKYGPFDITMMECGQYNKQWAQIHMMPEETALAHVDLQGKILLPIHWGAFKLALHEWTDPIERVKHKAQELGVNVVTPEIGQPIILNQPVEFNNWWIQD